MLEFVNEKFNSTQTLDAYLMPYSCDNILRQILSTSTKYACARPNAYNARSNLISTRALQLIEVFEAVSSYDRWILPLLVLTVNMLQLL
jgi:hypothetical protein